MLLNRMRQMAMAFTIGVLISLVVRLIFDERMSVDEHVFADKCRSMAQQSIEACEKYLPLSQKCEVVISAEVVE